VVFRRIPVLVKLRSVGVVRRVEIDERTLKARKDLCEVLGGVVEKST
jgi:hypothetical protein